MDEKVLAALKMMMNQAQTKRKNNTDKNLDAWFTYHSPTADDKVKYDKINAAAKELARVIVELCPGGQEQDQALLLIRQARMLGNAAIACKDK